MWTLPYCSPGEDECGTKLPVGDAAEMDLGDKLKRMQSLRAQVAAARREDRRLTRKEDEDHFEALCEQLDIDYWDCASPPKGLYYLPPDMRVWGKRQAHIIDLECELSLLKKEVVAELQDMQCSGGRILWMVKGWWSGVFWDNSW